MLRNNDGRSVDASVTPEDDMIGRETFVQCAVTTVTSATAIYTVHVRRQCGDWPRRRSSGSMILQRKEEP